MIALNLCAIPSVQAWSNGGYSADPLNPDYGTHDWIANRALGIQTRDVTFLSTTYHSKYLLGTEAPDNPAYIGDQSTHHVYYYSGGSLQDGASASRASAMYQYAHDYLDSSDFESAAFYIGAMTHYISDVGVFGHTMGSGTDWGAEAHHSDYETEFESRLGSIALPATSLEDQTAYAATTGLAYKITFGSGTIKQNTWMDANYNWGNPVFEASALASLYASVAAVAAAINHLMTEAAPSSSDAVPPAITITSPTSDSTYSTSSSTINLWGTASDNVGVSSVTWSNVVTGASGTALGTVSWSTTGISLDPGSNLITVTAHDAAGNIGTDTIAVTFAQTTAPTVTGTASTATGNMSLLVFFTCSPSGGAPPYKYSWAFGDGATSTLQHPSHIYSSAGTFNATVTVTDSTSNTAQWSKTITVTDPNAGDAGTLNSILFSGWLIIIAAANSVAYVILKRKAKNDG